VTNRAGMYRYHPHPHMRTGAQVYQGLAGVLLVQDDEKTGWRSLPGEPSSSASLAEIPGDVAASACCG
jgi:FtsP/CotA-like multicopper oxidase with cupredoxin domain